MGELTHVDDSGAARMVDVAEREVTVRTATAVGRVALSAEAARAVLDGEVKKGDVASVVRIAGIMGAKRTPDLIPLCHPIAVNGVVVEVNPTEAGIELSATVRTADRTGVEMEALTAVAVAGLTAIDMVKAIDPAATLTDVRVVAKDGGRSGSWRAQA